MNWLYKSSFIPKQKPQLQGKTKLIDSKQPSSVSISSKPIVIMMQQDMDEQFAQELIKLKVKAVINCCPTMSGKYPATGPLILLQHGIPIWEADSDVYHPSHDNCDIKLYAHYGCMDKSNIIHYRPFTKEIWLSKHSQAEAHMDLNLEILLEQSLLEAIQYKTALIHPFPPLELQLSLREKHVVIVSNGPHVRSELFAIKKYISDFSPVLIGVDQGAELLLECGYVPDLVIGHLESVSDHTLSCGAELVRLVSSSKQSAAYDKIKSLDLHVHNLAMIGTSENAAMLLAYEHDAELIVTVGAYTDIYEYMGNEKSGMGSSMLVRMKIGAKLVNVTGICAIYNKPVSWWKESAMTLGLSVIFIAASVIQLRWGMKHIVQLVWGAM
jgi:uncharacterized membrane-anchored protein